jgi:hypothetical protein
MKRACIVLSLCLLKSCLSFPVGHVHLTSVKEFRSSLVGSRGSLRHAAVEVSHLPGRIVHVRRSTSRAHTCRMHLCLSSEAISLAANIPQSLLVGPAEIWSKYEILLAQYPHAVDAATGIVLYLLGQLVSGLITRQEVPPDRLLRWMLFGSIDGLLTHDWYQAVELLGSHVGGDGWGKPLFMIASDTLVYTPLYCLVFIVVMVHKPAPTLYLPVLSRTLTPQTRRRCWKDAASHPPRNRCPALTPPPPLPSARRR